MPLSSVRRCRLVSFVAAAAVAVLLGGAFPAWAQVGVVLGTVTNAANGVPVTTGFVGVCDQVACTNSVLNAQGQYSVTVAPGTYVVFTSSTPLVDEIFGGIKCPVDCYGSRARAIGTPVVVGNGMKVIRNFALSPSGMVTGRVLDATTRAPIANMVVRLWVRFGPDDNLAGGTTDATGAFAATDLGPGTFHAHTDSATPRTFVDEIYGDIPCIGGCSPSSALTSGAPIVVTMGGVTAGIDFLLLPGARISGTVRDAATAAGLGSVSLQARVRVGASTFSADNATTSTAGTYVLDGLPAGEYFVTASAPQHVDEVHANRPCAASSCRADEIGSGDAVILAAGGAATVDFGLDAGGSISGSVTDAGNGTPVAATVQAYRNNGAFLALAGSATADAGGLFTVRGLTAGSYVVGAFAGTHATEIFGGVHCLPCTLDTIASGLPVPVASGANTPGVHIVMERAGTIRGTVTTTPSNAVAARVGMRLFRRGGPLAVVNATTDDAGQYAFADLPPGTYTVATAAARLDNEVYDNVACPGGSCSTAFIAVNGVGVQVGVGSTVNNINFSLGPVTGPPGVSGAPVAVNAPGGVQFTWTAPQAGGVATSYLFDAGLAPGTTFATLPVATNSLFVPGVPPGLYYVRVRGVNGAGAGPVSSELTLRVGPGGVVAPNAPFSVEAFVSAGRLTMTWRPPPSGPVPTSYVLEVGTADGLSNIAVVPVVGHLFQFDGVPPGYYFVRLRGVIAGAVGPPTRDIVMVAGNAPAPPSEPQALTSRQILNTVTITWRPPNFGPVTSYILEAGTAPGLANIVAFNTGSAATSLSVPGVPPGTYHLRLRAVNALGTSPPSPDLVLVVP